MYFKNISLLFFPHIFSHWIHHKAPPQLHKIRCVNSIMQVFYRLCIWVSQIYIIQYQVVGRYELGIQIRNMKMVFNIYGTQRWVTFEKLMMKIYDFFIRLSRLVIPYINIVQKSLRRWKSFYTILYEVTKRLSRIKQIIDFHHQFFKHYPMPSAINVKNQFQISDLDA